jgi:hypothetical protein
MAGITEPGGAVQTTGAKVHKHKRRQTIDLINVPPDPRSSSHVLIRLHPAFNLSFLPLPAFGLKTVSLAALFYLTEANLGTR